MFNVECVAAQGKVIKALSNVVGNIRLVLVGGATARPRGGNGSASLLGGTAR
jgi:hypothetical protein